MMMDKKLNNYHAKFYTTIAIFFIVLTQSLFLSFFVKREEKIVKQSINDTINKTKSIKNEKDMMVKSVFEFSNLNDIWFSIEENKKKPTNHTNNDIIIFLSSIAKKFGAQNFVVELTNGKQNQYYNVINASIKFNIFSEPLFFLIINSFKTMPDYDVFIDKVSISRNDSNTRGNISQEGLKEYNRKINNSLTLLSSGQKYAFLPEFLSVTLELKILLIH